MKIVKEWTLGRWIAFDLLEEWWDTTSAEIKMVCPKAEVTRAQEDECLEVRVRPGSYLEAQALLSYLEKALGRDASVVYYER